QGRIDRLRLCFGDKGYAGLLVDFRLAFGLGLLFQYFTTPHARMEIGLIAGFFTSSPANWFPLRKGRKEPM
ncbi:MAG: hypothetical protein KGJ72_11375, partial [Gammaproteobacteria bacterium]|nr:hypothetical protein [Gammaproteobacteria bacterium]